LSDFINKVVVCETLSGKTITGVLTGFDKFELILVELKDIKSKNPKKTVVFKHGLDQCQGNRVILFSFR